MSNTTHTRRIVTATYKVDPDRQEAFLELLTGCERTMLAEGLITDRPFVRMRSLSDPRLIVELFEWSDADAFDRAQEAAAVLEWWGKYESLWEAGGFGLDAVPESSTPWAQYQPLP